MKNNFNKAFTLVELIVVITILAVLATVAFISFQGYSSSSRDSVRLADLKNISKSFEINRTKGIGFPLPDKKIDITASGAIFQYQGELSQNILKSDLNIFDGGLDPQTNNPYGYSVNLARNKFQIIGFLENQETVVNIFQNANFAYNTDKYIKSYGDQLGILLNQNTRELIIETQDLSSIDIVNSEIDYVLKLGNDKTSFYSQKKLIGIHNLNGSCKNILEQNPSSPSGVYSVKIDGVNNIQVYCDMYTDGGGWTLIVKRKHSSDNIEECGNNINDFLHNPCNLDLLVNNSYLDNISYSLGEIGLYMNKSEYMFQQYSTGGLLDEDDAYIIETNSDLFPDSYDLHHVKLNSVCSLDKSLCDTTDVIWKYIGNNHFNSSRCNGGVGGGHGGNYGYCSDGANDLIANQYSYFSNSFLGDRNYYKETKLWGHSLVQSKDYQELIFVR